jgi:hypothetical protein
MNLLMVALARKIRSFGEVGGSNSNIVSEGKSRDNEDPKKESRKEPKKEMYSSSVINPSHSLLKRQVKVDIKP